jgi:hypothetical protein
MELTHLINVVNLFIQEVHKFWFELLTLQDYALPVFVGVVDLLVGYVAFKEASASMLVHEVLVYVGVYF